MEKKEATSTVATHFWMGVDTLARAVQDGHDYVKQSEGVADQLVREFHGPYYRGAGGADDSAGENHAYQLIASKIGEVVYANPKVQVGSRRSDLVNPVALPLQHYGNRWCADHGISELVEELYTDMEINFGVATVTLEENKGMVVPQGVEFYNTKTGQMEEWKDDKDVPMWGVPRRISWKDYAIDRTGASQKDAAFQAHRIMRDKDAILEEAEDDPELGWNVEVIREAEVRTGDSTKRGYRPMETCEIPLWEVWVPHAKLDPEEEAKLERENYSGVIYCYVDDSDQSRWAREPRPYYGPKTGPYVLFGLTKVPDEARPLSSLMATKKFSERLNAVTDANMDSAIRYKRVIAVDDSDPEIADKIQESEHDDVILIAGLDKNKVIPNVELGGLTAAAITHEERMRDLYDRHIGVSDAERGNTRTGQTATADAIAANASEMRDTMRRQKMERGVAKLLEIALWHAFEDDQVVAPLGKVADEEILMALGVEPGTVTGPVWFRGGGFDGSFEDNEITIEPFSMDRTGGGLTASRQLQFMDRIVGALPVMVQNPFVQWKKFWERQSDMLNVPGGADLFNWDTLSQMQALALQGAMQPPQQGMRPKSPEVVGTAPAPSQGSSAAPRAPMPGNMTGANAGGMVP